MRIDLTIRIDFTIRIELTIRIDSTDILIWSSHLILLSPRIIFELKNIHGFKLRIFIIVTVRFCLTCSVRCNFCNTMTRSKPVRVIRQPSISGSGAKDGLKFIRCVGGREPQIHELWSFAKDGITREVHPFARIAVRNFSGDCFHTNYATDIGR